MNDQLPASGMGESLFETSPHHVQSSLHGVIPNHLNRLKILTVVTIGDNGGAILYLNFGSAKRGVQCSNAVGSR